MTTAAIDHWNHLLGEIDAAGWCASLAEPMRARRLHFGGRLLCPFLRPFFLDAADEARVKHAAETLWTLGEHGGESGRVRAARLAAVRGIQRRIAGRRRLQSGTRGALLRAAADSAVRG